MKSFVSRIHAKTALAVSIASIAAFAAHFPSHASDQSATLTQVQGDVKIFTNPGKTAQGPAPHALYEGQYYSVRDAAPGEKIDKGNIVRAAPGARARVVYENGDQIRSGQARPTRFPGKVPRVARAPLK